MTDRDDDDYIQQFLLRAQNRQAKLASIGDTIANTLSRAQEEQPSYPHLSPLNEEAETTVGETSSRLDDGDTTLRHEETTNTDYHRENVSPNDVSDLNYSSDLSLGSDTLSLTTNTTSEVYRAEPAMIHSTPDPQPIIQQVRYASPRKATAPQPDVIHQPSSEQQTPLQERQQQEQKAASSQSLPNPMSDEKLIEQLKVKIDKVVHEKSKIAEALEKSKYASHLDYANAARLFKIKECEHFAYHNHLTLLEKGVRSRSDSLGALRITELRFKMTERLREELAPKSNVSHHFFCVASCGPEVRATELVDTDTIKKQAVKEFLEFNENFIRGLYFVNLPPDFVVKLELFELITNHSGGGSIKDSFEHFSAMVTPSKRARTTKQAARFRFIGNLRLTLSKRDATSMHLSQLSKQEESKYIGKKCEFRMELRPEQLPVKTGTLHVRYWNNERNRSDWGIYWVDLSGGQIRFWKSQQDALDGKKPNQTLEIMNVCSESVQRVTPDDNMFRQNSFLIYTIQQLSAGEGDTLFQRVSREDSKYKIVQHHLAAYCKEELDSWCSLLNKSIRCYREWNDTSKIHTIEELKQIFSQ